MTDNVNDEENWNPILGQMTALATTLGVLLGSLRELKMIEEDDLEDMCAIAHRLLPVPAGQAGVEAIDTIFGAAVLVNGSGISGSLRLSPTVEDSL